MTRIETTQILLVNLVILNAKTALLSAVHPFCVILIYIFFLFIKVLCKMCLFERFFQSKYLNGVLTRVYLLNKDNNIVLAYTISTMHILMFVRYCPWFKLYKTSTI